MLSSTALDLPEHRQEAIEACLRAGMFPLAMEAMPASAEQALAESLALVDRADLYVGIFAYRYGTVPAGETKSITHLEYARALARGIPVLAFLIDQDHPVKGGDVETGPGADALQALKKELAANRVVAYFKSPEDLRGHVVDALSRHRTEDASLHYVADVPAAPVSYVAHPYTLLQTGGLIGRRAELEKLTDWIVSPTVLRNVSMLWVVGLGGMGKSALTWHWYSEVVAQEMTPLAGRMWWSFYESDARFENFVIRALAYVSGRSLAEVAKQLAREREEELLRILDLQPFVLVLDGLERELVAYSGMRAAYVQDHDVEDAAAGQLASAVGLPSSAAQSYVGRHPQRKTTDPRVGVFLQKLARVRASRVLASTRLYPADLQTGTGHPRPGCAALFLEGLTPSDALELWRAHGARGSREVMLPVFERFERHPLLIQVLAGEVAAFREAPGDFDAWHKANPQFDPFGLPLVQVRSHVLEAALRGLEAGQLRALRVLAGFRMPTSLDTLQALLIQSGEKGAESTALRPFASLRELDAALGALEDRGLLGWDRRANRYDLHPIVRGVVWSGLGDGDRTEVYGALQTHFEAVPEVAYEEVESLEDLTPAIELFHSLVGLGRYDDARDIFKSRLGDATLYRLSASRQRVEMLERLFPDGVEALPRLQGPKVQSWSINALAQGYEFSGRPGSSVPFYRRAKDIRENQGDDLNCGVCLSNISAPLRYTGQTHSAAVAARESLAIGRKHNDRFREGVSLYMIGLTAAVIGDAAESETALRRSLQIWVDRSDDQDEGLANAFLAERALWLARPKEALPLAIRAWRLASSRRLERDFIRAARLQGTASLLLDDLAAAEERLNHALARARACHLAQEELPALTALAELHRRQKNSDQARELLDDVWELAERGPFPLFHADALNILAQIERDAGDRDAAARAATRAFTLAWCDGPPWAYHLGLETARRHVAALGVPEPELPPFDPAQHEPMPDVEIDPDDEYHAGRKPESSEPSERET